MLGGALVDAINWQAVFWMHIPVAVVAIAWLRVVPESRDSRHLPLDIPGAIQHSRSQSDHFLDGS